MHIGVPRETGPQEGRVAATPSAVRALVADGHVALVEMDAGLASGLSDDDYLRAGAEIVPTAEELHDRAELVWRVLRPVGHERSLLRPGQVVAALLHDGEPLPDGVEGLALERHPEVLAAMSELAGRLAVEAASAALQRQNGGRGLLLGGVPGVARAHVVVLGAGTAGRGAATLAAAMGADVTVLDTDLARLRALPGLRTLLATPHTVERSCADADVVIGAVRDGTGAAPRVMSRAHLALLQPGSVLVDLSVTDGGAFESTVPTTLEHPTRLVDGIVHVAVPNFAGGVPRTASPALAQAALPHVRRRAC